MALSLRSSLTALAVATTALVGAAGGVRSEPLPAATEALKDYVGIAVFQIELPHATPQNAPMAPGSINPGVGLWIDMRQAYVWPDRLLLDMSIMNASRQSALILGNTERSFSYGTGYVVETTYKNLDLAPENPIAAVQMSMATYATVLKDLTSGKLLPDENLEKLQDERKARLAELKKLREELKAENKPENLPRLTAAASEHARVRDDLLQIPFRRENPCHVIEFENKDLIRNLGAKGFMPRTREGENVLEKGKTRFWVTKTHGLPIKFETVDETGAVVVFFCFTELKVNTGLRQADLALNVPPGSPVVRAAADLKERNWETKLEKDIQRQIDAYDKIRRPDPRPKKTRPATPPRKRS